MLRKRHGSVRARTAVVVVVVGERAVRAPAVAVLAVVVRPALPCRAAAEEAARDRKRIQRHPPRRVVVVVVVVVRVARF